MPVPSSTQTLPLATGVGLRSPHMREAMERAPSVGWLEVHAENFMNRGTASSALEKIRTSYALSIHGVGLSLGSARGIDLVHLDRLKEVCRRFEPEAFIAALTVVAIGEIHLAGHAENRTPDGPVLVDSHSSRVSHQVWSLYASAIKRIGRRPTLIEWDADLPSLCVLLDEAMRADLLAGTVAFNELPQKKVTRDGSYPSNSTADMAAIQDGHAKTRNHPYTEGFHA